MTKEFTYGSVTVIEYDDGRTGITVNGSNHVKIFEAGRNGYEHAMDFFNASRRVYERTRDSANADT